ncbi:MAG: 2,3,4,5-tetrahydropyridine-2,6-dicarboxylate N-succinyltransferase [Ignavibacteriae bacterium]|nr:2,3,4,5-tetrahydropyridine-2,6-dicarboxylate N-succinyltransferase [Ignavibacteriota bacterium]
MKELTQKIEQLYSTDSVVSEYDIAPIKQDLIINLNKGNIRSAELINGEWKVNEWVKKGILLLYVARGVICMPPMYINIGAYVDENTMIDSHALVGTCAQLGKRVHLSAASQIGGVLEPPGARPVIVEDDVMIGGNCGVYEGVLIRKRAVLGSGVILNSSTKVYDIVNEKILKADINNPLEIPENAVVIPGSRLINTEFGKQNGLSISTAIIVKYRDDKTDARTALEQALR